MGHEYVEMKNPAAAIDAYRHAVDINPRDYRAWCGQCRLTSCRPWVESTWFLPVESTSLSKFWFQMSTCVPTAWYGLGQTYEILQMPYYALYYYQRWGGGSVQAC